MRQLLFALFCLFAAAGQGTSAEVDKSPETVSVLSYNLRYASDKGPNAWPDRRPLMVELLKGLGPDVVGTQEGLYPQLKDLAQALPEYEWIGFGRDGGSRGEFMAIFYRKQRFEPMAFDHFWLSDTPEVIGSSTWGNSNRRMVTWVRFLDRTTKREFYHFNTHFDHQVQLAREKSAALLRDRIKAIATNAPVVLTGDFNAGFENKAHSILTADDFMTDTWPAAKLRSGEGLGTFNNFKAVPKDGNRIDWILVRGNCSVDFVQIVTNSFNGAFPSDHFPLLARIRFNE